MDKWTFAVEMSKAWAWPVVAVLVVIVFRGKLTKLFDEVTELKGLGVEAKFARGAKEALAEVETIEAAEPPPAGPAPEPFDPNAPLDDPLLPRIEPINALFTTANPKAAVLMARSNIEAAVKRLVMLKGVTAPSGRANFGSMVRALRSKFAISEAVVKTSLELYALGSKAAHGDFEPDVSSARDFVQASEKLVRLLLSSKPDPMADTWHEHPL